MLLGGLQKLTLIDYPGKIAATIFTKGCNFRCGFCHNPELVLDDKISKDDRRLFFYDRRKRALPDRGLIKETEFFDFLKSRQGLLEGVCISGGEPNLQSDLKNFIKKIKFLGFLVKLDTNGSHPQLLTHLIENRLIDYLAMDIKAPLAKYAEVIFSLSSTLNTQHSALNTDLLSKVKTSIKLIMESQIDYEFRTTVIKGVHSLEDILEIAKMIKGAKRYYLQAFQNQNKLVNVNFNKKTSFSLTELEEMAQKCKELVEECGVRA